MCFSVDDFEIRMDELSEEQILEILKLDSLVYPDEYQSDFYQVSKRYARNKKSFIFAVKEEKIIGYICFFPITKFLRDSIITGQYSNDSDLNEEDVLSYEKAEGAVYIISIVVNPMHQHSDVIKKIMKKFDLHML